MSSAIEYDGKKCESYIVEDVAKTLWHKSDVCCFTPYKQIKT
jgi:hypothetical protein